MLKSLKIRNFAVIEDLELELEPGLNVFTGETGAGKSILVEALGFLLGERASTDHLRAGAPRLEVTGLLEARGRTLGLRRELDGSGKGRAFVSEGASKLRPAPVSELGTLGESWVDFHGQHAHQSLLRASAQLDLLDEYGGLGAFREKTRKAYEERSALRSELESVRLSEAEKARRLDLYAYQLAEIEGAKLAPGEEGELEAVLPRLKNLDRIRILSQTAYAALYEEEGSAQEKLLRAERALEELSRLDPSLGGLPGPLAQARVIVEEAAEKVRGLKGLPEETTLDLDGVLSRLDQIAKLKKKYGPTVPEVLAFGDKLSKELGWLRNSEARQEELERSLRSAEGRFVKLGREIHDKRTAAARRLSQAVLGEFKDLGMGEARFSIPVEMEEGVFHPTGCDQVEYLFSANPGEPLKALRSTASGGELSRTMLALKTALSNVDPVPVLVFDEVDAGVGGVVAREVGRKLLKLSRERQILCVTHLPQIAAWAHAHFSVSKEVVSGRTFARVSRLGGPERLKVLARMMGGRAVTPTSLQHAQELLESK